MKYVLKSSIQISHQSLRMLAVESATLKKISSLLAMTVWSGRAKDLSIVCEFLLKSVGCRIIILSSLKEGGGGGGGGRGGK